MKTAGEIALLIARDLFRNGQGQVAIRLVLELKGGRDGGGWCRGAVVDRVEAILMREMAKKPRGSP